MSMDDLSPEEIRGFNLMQRETAFQMAGVSVAALFLALIAAAKAYRAWKSRIPE